MWGDFCRKRRDRETGQVLDELELNTHGYDMTIPGIQIPMNKKTVIPEPENHFSFSTKLMLMAIDLYEEEAPPNYSPFTTFAIPKLRKFVESRKELTAQSYRFFVEHAYNQFFQHEAFHQSARARTKAKDIGAGEFHTSTKLEGYVWVSSTSKMKHVPIDQAEDVEMQSDSEELDDLPRLDATVKKEEKPSGSSHIREEPQFIEVEEEEESEDELHDVKPAGTPLGTTWTVLGKAAQQETSTTCV